MFCIAAFIMLGILGIFSATYRGLAKEALDCVLRRVTLRPCTTGFDEKMKSRMLGSVINRSERAARLLNRNFELLSWVFFLLTLASTALALRGSYLFYLTGSCSGLNQTSFCPFDPKGKNSKVSGIPDSCRLKPTTVADLTLNGVNLAGYPTLNQSGTDKIVLIGCYGCGYTRQAYPKVKELAEENGAAFTFMEYPIKTGTTLMARLGNCVYRLDEKKYWKLNDILLAAQVPMLDDTAFARKTTEELGLDWGAMDRCLNDPVTKNAVDWQMEEALKTQFFGTPTVFIGDQAFVGPKPYRVYAISLNGLFYWIK